MSAQEIPFKHVIIDPHPDAGVDCCTDVCAVGDLNGDGYLDVVIGAENADSSGLVWYEYPAWTKHPVGSGEFTTDGQTGDVDGDGDPDIIVSDYGHGIFWYENPRNSTAQEWMAHLIGPGYGHDVEIGDVDGDGDLDVVTCDKKQLLLWQQINPTTWKRHTIFTNDGEGTALADLNRDGDLDVVYGGLWLEAPDSMYGAPWPQHIIDDYWPRATRVKVADMNGDGCLDVILSVSEGYGNLAWFEAPVDPKSGIWCKHLIESSELQGAHSLQVADLDNDRDLDVVTAEMHTSAQKRVIVYINEGLDHWARQIVAKSGSHNLRVGDIGSDGDIDLIGKNFGGPGRIIEMWENGLSAETHVVHELLPDEFDLSRSYPNPFSPALNLGGGMAIIELVLPDAEEIDLSILNLVGQKIRTLAVGWRNAGQCQFRWDGKNDNGTPVPAGLYFFQLRSSKYQAISKVTLIR
ncbi:MAG: FG-GAP-like repeat-containing protein [candidate division KSB1 bacterium]|nr:FG-GAP-like repeat-containing protein [candidate division KSB1 bacterium]MDZ7301668.1 FG-GAP-like repeat-containing protein [candidate division KSB1 bacterium]MDZ7314308.1 FG-GAP-like repeat-containing protein [candidate division KSB1 bacterium]